MDLLENTIQPYAWGSRTAIAELLGRPAPSPGPEAELWMGAHPSAPSRVARGAGTLDAVIADDPETELGPAVAETFGGRLPFLLKVLAADKALSIQVHPTREQAEAGYTWETERGITAREFRNYVDDWPKPEVICALTEFEALAGLRDAPSAADLLTGLGVPELTPLANELRRMARPATVAAVLGKLLEWPKDERADLVATAVKAASGRPETAYQVITRLNEDHPGDVGVIGSLLLNHVILAPGQAMFMPAGGLHAYIRGTGVELMANSDNVLRAGLTPKRIDVPELLRIVNPKVGVPVVTPRQEAPGVDVFDLPVPEIRLARLTLEDAADAAVPGEGPRILFCADGAVEARAAGTTLTLARGASCYIPASDGAVTVTGTGTAFAASAGI